MLIFYIVVTLLFSVRSYGEICPQPLKIAVAESWPSSVLENLARYHQPFKEIGCTVEYQKVPLSRSLQMVSNGKLDGDTYRIAGLEKDYPNLIRVATPMARFGYYLYKKRKASLNIDQPKSLAGSKTCITFGNRLRRQISNELKLQVLEASNTSQCLKMLMTDRVDIFIGPRPEVEDSAFWNSKDDYTRAEKPYVSTNLYIYLNDRHREVAKQLEKILGKYFITDN
ncbi:substrate-binding periplasmic protein [Bdellovibrio sp. HCB274]|uniref:substrate-binding periplasmic protein n=1 Tax=Bdellovibrio sp. HCB274 TaxID=3394361 RepID=UPI0039B473E1